jgi:hypothetical protein
MPSAVEIYIMTLVMFSLSEIKRAHPDILIFTIGAMAQKL